MDSGQAGSATDAGAGIVCPWTAPADGAFGLRPITSDGCPVIGSLDDGLIVAAGNGPEGLTAGPWTGLAAAALALGEQPATDLAPFDPARFRRRCQGIHDPAGGR